MTQPISQPKGWCGGVNGVNESSYEAMFSVVKDGLEKGKQEDAIRQDLKDTFLIDDDQSGRVFAATIESVDSQLVRHLLIREIAQPSRTTWNFFQREKRVSLTELFERNPSLRETIEELRGLPTKE